MNIALLNTRVTFQKKRVCTDERGNQSAIWEDFYSCAATISNEGDGERFVAVSEEDRTDMAVTIRWSARACRISPTGFRILFQGVPFDIFRIDHLSFKRHALKFFCRKERMS